MTGIRLDVAPVPKPRMTRRDRWSNRPAVTRYWAYRDYIRWHYSHYRGIDIEQSLIVFAIPMPQSWSKRKKENRRGQRHRAKPDLDNLLKGLWDATHKDGDEGLALVVATKVWADTGYVEFLDLTLENLQLYAPDIR